MSGEALNQKTINLALQGGGSHGAFTWGVLDALLEDGRLDFEGISATSAGAMNAAVMAYGKTTGGAAGARQALEDFWRGVSRKSAFYNSFFHKNPFFNYAEEVMSRVSPYQFNPYNLNPLKEILESVISDMDEIHRCECVKLFVNATNVRTGTPKVFGNEDVSIDALLASACLPQLFQAIEIDGEAYWDGGYLGNPSLWPLFYHAKCRDILLVHINPIARQDVPREVEEIENRLNEITFNAALLKELRSIEFVQRLVSEDMLKEEYKDHYKDILLHSIRTDNVMADLAAGSKADTDWSFLVSLKDLGRAEARVWLEKHFDDIGKKASVDIKKDYLPKL